MVDDTGSNVQAAAPQSATPLQLQLHEAAAAASLPTLSVLAAGPAARATSLGARLLQLHRRVAAAVGVTSVSYPTKALQVAAAAPAVARRIPHTTTSIIPAAPTLLSSWSLPYSGGSLYAGVHTLHPALHAASRRSLATGIDNEDPQGQLPQGGKRSSTSHWLAPSLTSVAALPDVVRQLPLEAQGAVLPLVRSALGPFFEELGRLASSSDTHSISAGSNSQAFSVCSTSELAGVIAAAARLGVPLPQSLGDVMWARLSADSHTPAAVMNALTANTQSALDLAYCAVWLHQRSGLPAPAAAAASVAHVVAAAGEAVALNPCRSRSNPEPLVEALWATAAAARAATAAGDTAACGVATKAASRLAERLTNMLSNRSKLQLRPHQAVTVKRALQALQQPAGSAGPLSLRASKAFQDLRAACAHKRQEPQHAPEGESMSPGSGSLLKALQTATTPWFLLQLTDKPDTLTPDELAALCTSTARLWRNEGYRSPHGVELFEQLVHRLAELLPPRAHTLSAAQLGSCLSALARLQGVPSGGTVPAAAQRLWQQLLVELGKAESQGPPAAGAVNALALAIVPCFPAPGHPEVHEDAYVWRRVAVWLASDAVCPVLRAASEAAASGSLGPRELTLLARTLGEWPLQWTDGATAVLTATSAAISGQVSAWLHARTHNAGDGHVSNTTPGAPPFTPSQTCSLATAAEALLQGGPSVPDAVWPAAAQLAATAAVCAAAQLERLDTQPLAVLLGLLRTTPALPGAILARAYGRQSAPTAVSNPLSSISSSNGDGGGNDSTRGVPDRLLHSGAVSLLAQLPALRDSAAAILADKAQSLPVSLLVKAAQALATTGCSTRDVTVLVATAFDKHQERLGPGLLCALADVLVVVGATEAQANALAARALGLLPPFDPHERMLTSFKEVSGSNNSHTTSGAPQLDPEQALHLLEAATRLRLSPSTASCLLPPLRSLAVAGAPDASARRLMRLIRTLSALPGALAPDEVSAVVLASAPLIGACSPSRLALLLQGIAATSGLQQQLQAHDGAVSVGFADSTPRDSLEGSDREEVTFADDVHNLFERAGTWLAAGRVEALPYGQLLPLVQAYEAVGCRHARLRLAVSEALESALLRHRLSGRQLAELSEALAHGGWWWRSSSWGNGGSTLCDGSGEGSTACSGSPQEVQTSGLATALAAAVADATKSGRMSPSQASRISATQRPVSWVVAPS